MAGSENRILKKLLDRLFASLINGPSLNCRPHSSRQRIDLLHLGRLKDQAPEQILRELLGPERQTKVSAKAVAPRTRATAAKTKTENEEDGQEPETSPEEKTIRQAFSDQQAVFSKLRSIAEDARTYENDTGVHVLQIGFPLLSLPPGSSGKFGLTRRIMAPLAFVALSMTVKGGPSPSVVLECRNEGADLVVPNTALLAWLEQQTGQSMGELFSDETGEKPWAEIVSIVRRVCELAQVEVPAELTGEEMPADFKLVSPSRSDEEDEPRPSVLPAAVVGLYPMANQGLLRDMQALAGGEPVTGPIESFIRRDLSLNPAPAPDEPPQPVVEKRTRSFADERLVATADPCQARAVRLARTSRGLVVHGPPGTGKSQTISNIVGDHLARGQRVLFVCDKRTALDVVMNRLEGMGLGALCAIVHDPQRDQRELYKSIREQLDTLADLRSDASAQGKLAQVDAELEKLHGELTDYHAALMKKPDKDTLSFHELMGRWLASPQTNLEIDPALLKDADDRLVDQHALNLTELFDRAAQCGYATNPWTCAAGLALDEYLTAQVDDFRIELAAFVELCAKVDQTIDPAILPIPSEVDLKAITAARASAADVIERARISSPNELRARWATVDPRKIAEARQKLREASEYVSKIEKAPLDRELKAILGNSPPSLPQIAQQTAALDAYSESTRHFLGFLAFGKKSAAAKVLAQFGLQPSAEAATRVSSFLTAIKFRLLLADLMNAIAPEIRASAIPDDEAIVAAVKSHQLLLDALAALHGDVNLADARATLLQAVADVQEPIELLRGLRATAHSVATLIPLEAALRSRLFSDSARKSFSSAARGGNPVSDQAQTLADRFDSMENVLRVRDGLAALPETLRPAAARVVEQNAPGEPGLAAIRKVADANEIARRIKSNRVLMTADGQRLQASFQRYQQLDATRKELTRQVIIHYWATKQKERLLASTGSRLNSHGADLRRRLTTRGERAMRLRQVISVGQNIEGGDPLFDLRPVWMASPETVAQLFGRQAMFDVVIFDEASQCRLEEALPVLLRAQRVVIAGDPKQLPPTRFFESAVAASEEQEIETDQQLFESQQSEIEDLLAAALNLEIEECYLDVHYRSRNSDLIEFSNEQFYKSRLQSIPGHPRNRTRFAPLSLEKVNGVYDKRVNAAEAERVCQIVRDLLKRASPPSIGIACFNIAQRDLIIEKLDELAETDTEFGRSLAAARERRSKSSFEGLFVKNLENVQGDERDHIIISTTYGPDAKGRFYRRFGPLGTAGGGRRLNVLVTRAREEVHLVTSIPQTVYRSLPPIPAGQSPGGAWLLFAYLVYAERLAELYEENHRILEQAQTEPDPTVNVRQTRFPSTFAAQLGQDLCALHQTGSDVHWGNDGFCIDLALHHPHRADDVTVGVLCDLNRFEQAADPIEWEVFRTAVLQSQGWEIARVWTPHFFRDRSGVTTGIIKQSQAMLAQEDDPDSIRTVAE